MFDFGARITAHNDGALTALTFAKIDGSVDFSHNGWFFRRTSFKQFGYTWQTTSDVVGTGDFARGRCQQSTAGDLRALSNTQGCFFRDRIVRDRLARIIFQQNLRMQVTLPLKNNAVNNAGRRIALFAHGHFRNDVLKAHCTCNVGENRNVRRFPFDNHHAFFDDRAIFCQQLGTDRNFETFDGAIVLVMNDELTVTVQHDHFFVAVDNRAQVFVDQFAWFT